VEIHVPSQLLANARELRKRQTGAEELLWQLLRDRKLNNLKFRRQHPLSVGFIIDFYCAEQRLGIEIDGGYHNSAEQQKRDTERTKIINKYGIKIIRFSNEDVLNNTENILKEILHSAFPPLSKNGEGSGVSESNDVRNFSHAAIAVFNAGRQLWRYYHAQPKCNVNASLYDIREFFQGRNEKGIMNNKSSDEKYNELIGNLRLALKDLARKIEPKVYEYGFLRG
jgi:very-short-patch-repair endonuclease